LITWLLFGVEYTSWRATLCSLLRSPFLLPRPSWAQILRITWRRTMGWWQAGRWSGCGAELCRRDYTCCICIFLEELNKTALKTQGSRCTGRQPKCQFPKCIGKATVWATDLGLKRFTQGIESVIRPLWFSYTFGYTVRVLLFVCNGRGCVVGAFTKLRKATVSFVMCLSACPHGTTRVPTGLIFMNFDIWVFFEKSVKNNGYSTWIPVYIYDNISLNSS
jgi:hypothetical protein